MFIVSLSLIIRSPLVLKILEAIKNNSPHSKFVQLSTSELFGKVLETPQTETTPFNPVSPYGAAKLYGFYITQIYLYKERI